MKKNFWILLFLLASCDIFDKEEPAPSYIYIGVPSLQVAANGSEGANTHGIIDAHVFANDFFVGTIELPGTVPVLQEGSTKITIGAGIKNNGITSNRIIYPFYELTEYQLDLIPNSINPISSDSSVVFQYFPSNNPSQIGLFLEEFEGVGNIWEPATIDGAGVINTSNPDEVLSGSGSGKIVLDDDFPSVEVYADQVSWDMSQIVPGSAVYLELDYKGNNPLEIGIRTSSPQISKVFALGLNPSDEWVKVYVELSNEIGQAQTNSFQVYLEAEKVTADPLGTILLDNMKLVYPDI